ncbi:MAG: DUF3016 domain-containing protein [Pseudomonadota bacterium]
MLLLSSLHPPHPARLLAAGLLAACAAVTATGAAAGTADVAFIAPEKYTDASYSHPVANESDRAQVLRDVEQHLQRLATRGLAASDTLKIEVLDIDLAGHFPPLGVVGSDVRVVTDITGPHIKLRYRLVRDGSAPVSGGEDTLSDLNFMVPSNRYPSGDRLRYEKALLDRWFEKRFAAR